MNRSFVSVKWAPSPALRAPSFSFWAGAAESAVLVVKNAYEACPYAVPVSQIMPHSEPHILHSAFNRTAFLICNDVHCACTVTLLHCSL